MTTDPLTSEFSSRCLPPSRSACCDCINLTVRYSPCVQISRWSAVSKSGHSLLSPSLALTNKLELLSKESPHLVNTLLNLCKKQRGDPQKEYMSIDRPLWPRLVHTIACYWCCGIAFEGRQIDIMEWCGPLKGRAPAAPVWLTDLGSIFAFASSMFGVCAQTRRVLRGWRMESLSEKSLQTGNWPLLPSQLIFTANRLMWLILWLL